MRRKMFAVLLVFALAGTLLAGCSPAAPAAPEQPEAPAAVGNEVGPPAPEEPYRISVIVKATDSDYWQTLLAGARAAEADSDGRVVVTTDGPPSEMDIARQVEILENVIATRPHAVVISSTSSDATVPAVEAAMAAGIPVITIDNKLNTDQFITFLATDHRLAASMAAEAMVSEWEARGINPSGKKVIVISSVAGTMVNTARTEGFIEKMKELVPDIVVLATQYGDNDIARALSIAESTIAANPDLIGIFGDNNHMGVGIAAALEQSGKYNEIVSFAFDTNPDQIEALRNGVLAGLVVQDPFGMGYRGVMYAIEAIEGREVQKNIIVPATIVTRENMTEPEIHKLLHPLE